MTDQRWLLNEYANYTDLHNLSYPISFRSDLLAPLVLDWDFEISNPTTLPGVQCDKIELPIILLGGENMSSTVCSCRHGYQGNPYLSCEDIDECKSSSLNNCPIGTTCVNTAGSFSCQVQANDSEPRTKPVIIGVSCGLGGLVLLGGALVSSNVARKRIEANRKKKFFKRNGGFLLLSSTNNTAENIRFFNSKELALATDRYNENRVLGRGGQGTVYKGMLPNGRIVAVKKSEKMDESEVGAFVNEVVILSQINHRNVVKLLGCCLETEVPLLVYEFVPNGTLFQHIHDLGNEFPLSWKIRVKIATEVAAALATCITLHRFLCITETSSRPTYSWTRSVTPKCQILGRRRHSTWIKLTWQRE